MTEDPRAELLGLLRQVRTRLLATLDGSPDEVADCDALIRDLEKGDDRRLGSVASLFLPTGILQDIAIGSGWGDVFCSIADRVEQLLPLIGKGGSS